MAEKILMPRLSDTMTEGVIAAWHKKVGDPIKKGDLLAEVETDKATMELESYKDGVLLHIGIEKGGKLQVDDLLAIVGNSGEDISQLLGLENNTATAKTAAKPAATPENNGSTNGGIDIGSMDEVVLMPRLSDTMTEGVIAGWLKQVGDAVKKGDLLAEIETDKATMELESYKNGTLLYQGAKKGEKILVNDLLCIIGDAGKIDVAVIVNAAKSGGQPMIPAIEEATPNTVAASQTDAVTIPAEANGRIKASPLAKKLATEKGISLAVVNGSGDGGRIVKADIDNYKAIATAAPATPAPVTTKADPALGFSEVPITQMRKVIAKRLSESLFTAPHFYLTMPIDMDNAIASRNMINDGNVKVSFNDLVIKACAMALKKHPAINSSWLGDSIRTNYNINIGVAVAVEDGLLVPVVRNADTKTLTEIGHEVKAFAQKAKDKKLQPADWEGNTFTISNLGMFGIEEFTAIINPPDACILAVGGISQVPVIKNGAVVVGNIMKLTLSCDHRVVDGATGAAFLQTLKSLLEAPIKMIV